MYNMTFLTKEALFDCLNAIYIYLDVELLSEMINLQTQLITVWDSNIELILKEPSEKDGLSFGLIFFHLYRSW